MLTDGHPRSTAPDTDARHRPAIVIGAGHAGLAVSACLTERGIDHVVLERGRIAQRWRDRWDSLTLLSPDAYNRLPGQPRSAGDEDAFGHRDDLITALESYARATAAPVLEGVRVRHVRRESERWRVHTDRGDWSTDDVVVATGHCDVPHLPTAASALSAHVAVLHSDAYRNPRQLATHDGTILVVGAGASGQQLALELVEAGRKVALAVGSHTRLPRRYRGRDVYWWLDRLGVLHQPLDARARAAIRSGRSAALSGRCGGRDLDLDVLERAGVRLLGRFVSVDAGRTPAVRFAGDLAATRAEADSRCAAWLDRFDAEAAATGLALPTDRYLADRRGHAPASVRRSVETSMPLDAIGAVVFATGYRRDFSWIEAPVFDRRGEPRHDRGVTDAPGLQFIGLRGQHTRSSGFLGGAAADARHLADHIAARAARAALPTAPERAEHAA